MKNVCVVMLKFASILLCSHPQKTDYPVTPLPFNKVQLTDIFRLPRLVSNYIYTIPNYAWAHRDQGEMRVWFPVLQ